VNIPKHQKNIIWIHKSIVNHWTPSMNRKARPIESVTITSALSL